MKPASVQTVRLGLHDISADVVVSTDGDFHAIVEVSGTASPFEDDARQEAVLAGFATFLNGLSYPIQIVVRATPIDLSGYLATLEERGRQSFDGQLAELAHDHAQFVQALARQKTLLERRYYVVVAAEHSERGRWRWGVFGPGRTSDDEARREAARQQLTFRCDDLGRQLARCGLAVRRLGDSELADLYLACWSPERARVQRFHQRLDAYATLAVRCAVSSGGSA